ncbi:MAG TPA: ACP S-malonyltransferase [Kiritimatiellia bacterium]|jgi:[acyl-carrier-protein] S-malonyltransferase
MSKRAILFPGQGAQAVGMGKDFAESVPECRALFDRAAAVLGYDLASICFDGPIEKLTISAHAQPGIFVASMACWTALQLQKPGIGFDYAAGLSSGEWTALHVAGVVGFEDTLRVLEARGRFMQEACDVQKGGMLAVIGAERAALDKICAESGIEMANFNSPEQTVLSGPADGVARAEKLARELGLKKVLPLNVAGAFHSRLMKPAADRLVAVLQGIDFKPARLPVISNVTGRPHGGPDEIRSRMVDQIVSSVQWVLTVEWLKEQGTAEYVECGPGKVLTGLVKRIDKTARLTSIQDRSSLQAASNP